MKKKKKGRIKRAVLFSCCVTPVVLLGGLAVWLGFFYTPSLSSYPTYPAIPGHIYLIRGGIIFTTVVAGSLSFVGAPLAFYRCILKNEILFS